MKDAEKPPPTPESAKALTPAMRPPAAPKQPIRPGAAAPPVNRPAAAPRAIPLRNNQDAPIGVSGVRALYIGRPVTGKTTKMLGWPGVVFIQFDEERSVVDGTKIPIPVIDVPDWDTWKQLILPAIKSGRLQQMVNAMPGFEDYVVRTVAIDSFTGLGEMCEGYCRGLESNTMRMYGEKLNELRKMKDELFPITRPRPNLPTWNLIGAVHEREVSKTVKDPSSNQFREIVEAVVPSITGQFGERFLGLWAVVLWCYFEVPHNAEGERLRDKPPQYFCLTGAIDQWRAGVDRLGGGRLPRLPFRVSGDYAELAQRWGISQPTKDDANGTK